MLIGQRILFVVGNDDSSAARMYTRQFLQRILRKHNGYLVRKRPRSTLCSGEFVIRLSLNIRICNSSITKLCFIYGQLLLSDTNPHTHFS